MKKILLIAFVLFLIACSLFLITNSKLLITNHQSQSVIHYHAGFLVYVDGVLQDFSVYKYMEISACKIAEEAKTLTEIQIEKAHLHDGIGDVVHVHQQGAVWGDLFKNINFILSPSKTITGYINGKEIGNVLLYPIKPYDSVIFAIGSNQGIDLQKYVTVDHIKQVEKKSESCGI